MGTRLDNTSGQLLHAVMFLATAAATVVFGYAFFFGIGKMPTHQVMTVFACLTNALASGLNIYTWRMIRKRSRDEMIRNLLQDSRPDPDQDDY